MKYGHLANAVFNSPWAITEEMFETITSILRFRMEGGTLSAEEIKARIGAQEGDPEPRAVDKIAILPLFGVISQRMNMMTAVSGGTSTEVFGSRFRAAVADESVVAIVIEVDSPGGSINGLEELANDIYNARGTKPIIAVANPMMASAAYWIASAADSIYVAPGGAVGSIGVIAEHSDFSKMEEEQGIKTTLITSSRFKGEGHPSKPLSSSAQQHMQNVVNEFGATFVSTVARHRDVDEETVRSDFGQGRMLLGPAALEAGMVDGIATLREVLAQLGASLEPTEPTPPSTPDPSDVTGDEGAIAARSQHDSIPQKEEHDMDPQICQALGLAEGTELAAIVTAINDLKAKATDIASGEKGEANQLRRELAEARQSLLTQESESAQEILTLTANHRQKEAQWAVDSAIAAGRVAPKDREVAMKLALTDPKAFETFSANLRVDLSERGTATDAVMAGLEPNAEEAKAAAELGITREALIQQKARDAGVTVPA